MVENKIWQTVSDGAMVWARMADSRCKTGMFRVMKADLKVLKNVWKYVMRKICNFMQKQNNRNVKY